MHFNLLLADVTEVILVLCLTCAVFLHLKNNLLQIMSRIYLRLPDPRVLKWVEHLTILGMVEGFFLIVF